MECNREYYDLLSKARPYIASNSPALDDSPALDRVEFSLQANTDTNSDVGQQVTVEEQGGSVVSENENGAQSNDQDFVRVTMAQFLEHMLSPDGGQRDRKSAIQTVNEVRCIINILDGMLKNLFERNKS